ncbi:MAG: 5'-nucleotidase, lipoprotein e(P4) family [Smithella sp.]
MNMKTRQILLLFSFALLPGGCATFSQEHQVNAVVYKQTAAEARALYYQAFNIARLRLDKILHTKSASHKPFAVVVDIDETVLDNTPYEVSLIQTGKENNTQSWKAWTAEAKAQATPGSVEFLQYAKSKGVHVLYITNRLINEQDATLRNLQRLGFPEASPEHIYSLHTGNSTSKESRRIEVAKRYNIIMLIGDNLSDFSDEFSIPGISPRARAVDRAKREFGDRYIILPNPMYGDWETLGVYEGRTDLSPGEKDVLRKKVLQGDPYPPKE